ncbi:hypothetical protein EV368DRAFT_70099 [Lentinula lateritia]|nr:hypothetical protein EV368DRAFT_70099 [Lentinula lateritia]
MTLLKVIKRTADSDGQSAKQEPIRRFPIHEVQAKEWNSSHLYPESRKQHLLSRNHILIRNYEPPDQSELAFSDSTFAEHIGDLHELCTLHDHTQVGKVKPSVAHMPGAFMDLIQAAATPNGKIINCLDIPLSPDIFPPSHGIATDSVAVLVGAKYWIIGVPKGIEDLGNISAFGEGYQLDMSNDQDWDVYGIILHPGDTL